MISISISADTAATHAFLVGIQGDIQRPRALHEELAMTLVAALQQHFRARNQESNRLHGPKTGFWGKVADETLPSAITDEGATVTVGRGTRFRIHLLGGTIKPKRGKFLTIPLVKEARGMRAAEYERSSGHKLFRVGGVLMERTDQGDRTTLGKQKSSVRTRSGFRAFNLSPRTRIRPVYALTRQAVIPKDPQALPPQAKLVAALQQAADSWAAREIKKQGGPA